MSGEAQASGHAEGMGAESSASVRLVYQPNCMRCDEMGSGVRLDLRGQVIEREPVCGECGALAPLAEAAPPLDAEEGASPAAAQPLKGQATEDDKAWALQAVSDAYEGRCPYPAAMSMTLEEIKVLHEQGKMTDEQFEFNKECIKLRDEQEQASEADTQREQSTGNGGGAEDADKTGTEDVKVVNSENELHTAKYGLDVAPPPPSQHLCAHCRRPLDMNAKGLRMVSKHPPTYKCPVCNSRHVTLTRQFGTWPLEEFTFLSDEEQSIFYKSVAERGADHKTVEDLLVEVLSKRRLAISRSSEIGKFLPLGVWKTQGWNTDEIVKNARPEDIETNKLGMLTYRVVVKETEKSKIEEDVRTALRKIVKQNGGCRKGGRHELTLGRREESAEAEVDERPRSRSRSRSRCSSKRSQHSSSRSVSKHSKRKRSRSKSGRSRRTRSKRSKSKSHKQRRRSSKSQQSRRKRSRSKSRRSRHRRSRSQNDQRRRRSKSAKKRGSSKSDRKKGDRQRTPKRSPSRRRSPHVDPKLAAREARKREQEAAREKRREERKAEREKERKEREAEREKDKEEKRIAKETVDTCQKLLVMTAPLAAKFEAALQHPRLKWGTETHRLRSQGRTQATGLHQSHRREAH